MSCTQDHRRHLHDCVIHTQHSPDWGRHTGLTRFVNVTGFLSFRSAMSWLYVLTSKFRCLMMADTARMMAGVSVASYWSWSPRNTRILERFNLSNGHVYVSYRNEPTNVYKRLRVSCIMNICLLHVSVTLVAILKEVLTKDRLQKGFHPVHKCKILRLNTYSLKYVL